MTTHPSRRTALQLVGAGLIAACAETRAVGTTNSSTGWRDGPSLPEPVQEIYPCAHKGMIHQAGGFVAANGSITGPTDAHWALDPSDSVWRPRASLPSPRHHPQLVSFAGELYCLGGFESSSDGMWQMQSSVWRYDEDADSWTSAPQLPAPNGESTIGVIGDALHVVGGRQPKANRNLDWSDHADVGTHFRFDGESWETAAPLPTPRNSAAGGVLDGKLHIAGGRTVGGGNLPTHELYDPASDSWQTLAPMPKAQAGLAAAVVGEKLYAFGGEYFENGGGVFPNGWMYVPVHDEWSALPDMPKPRHGLGGAALDGSIYLIGGALKASGNDTSAAVEIYTP